MNLTMQQGLRFNRSFRFQKFNYATGRIEAVDITGHEYEFSIYEPVEADLVITNKVTGQKVEGKVQLSAEETMHYRALKTAEERKAFEATLAPKYARQLLAKATRAVSESSSKQSYQGPSGTERSDCGIAAGTGDSRRSGSFSVGLIVSCQRRRAPDGWRSSLGCSTDPTREQQSATSQNSRMPPISWPST